MDKISLKLEEYASIEDGHLVIDFGKALDDAGYEWGPRTSDKDAQLAEARQHVEALAPLAWLAGDTRGWDDEMRAVVDAAYEWLAANTDKE